MTDNKFIVGGLIAGTLALGTIGIAEQAQASTLQYEWSELEEADRQYYSNPWCASGECYGGFGGGLNNKVGIHKSITTTFDDVTEELTWSSTFAKTSDGELPDGFWLVLSDGPNPKNHDYEYAIFYLDGIENKLTAYAYNGQNNSSSWNTNPFLGSWDGDNVSVVDNGNERTLSFSIDASEMNSRNDLGDGWKGATFGEEVGIWFHAVDNLNTDYDANNHLTHFSGSGGWFDTGALKTEKVPEPGTIGAIGVGLLGLVGASKRKKKGN